MNVERLKYVIWAADMKRAVNFYTTVFGGTEIFWPCSSSASWP